MIQLIRQQVVRIVILPFLQPYVQCLTPLAMTQQLKDISNPLIMSVNLSTLLILRDSFASHVQIQIACSVSQEHQELVIFVVMDIMKIQELAKVRWILCLILLAFKASCNPASDPYEDCTTCSGDVCTSC